MKEKMRHYFNPLHVYCRLVSIGFCRKKAQSVCAVYEKFYGVVL